MAESGEVIDYRVVFGARQEEDSEILEEEDAQVGGQSLAVVCLEVDVEDEHCENHGQRTQGHREQVVDS